jgi:polysaccharide biosynthesis transport protein
VREPSPYFIRRTGASEQRGDADAAAFSFDREEGLDLLEYWETVRRHMRLVAVVFLGALVVAAVHLSMQVPLYTAQTTILIGPEEPGIVEPGSVVRAGQTTLEPDYFTTQCDILKSRSLAARVIRSQGLEHSPALTRPEGKPNIALMVWNAAARISPFASSHDARGHSSTAPAAREPAIPGDSDNVEVDSPLINAYLGRLVIKPVENTSLVTISFTSTDPKISAAVANAHAAEYIRQGIEIRSQGNREAERFLRQKLVGLKEQLEKSEIALNDYRRAKGIVPGLMSLNGKDAVVVNRLEELSRDLTQAQVGRIGLEAQVQLIRQKKYNELPAVMGNTLIQGLEGQINDLYGQQASLADQFKPDYPPLAQLQAKLSETRERLNQEIGHVVQGIEAAYQEALERERKLEAETDSQRTLTLSINDAAVQYAILQRDVDTNRQLYDSVLKAMKDVGVLAETQTSNISVIDRAEPPDFPSSPRPLRTMTLAAVLGLVGGIGLAFVLEYLDNSLKTPQEAERYLGLPALAAVPNFASQPTAYTQKRLPGSSERAEKSLYQELAKPRGYGSSLLEAYRHFRTALLLSRPGAPPKAMLITSALAREGKTVTAVNTAVMFAQLGSRVLLIDADLRRPRCHQFFSLDNRVGLTEVLAGGGNPEDFVRPTCLQHLFVLGSGSTPPNPTELLGSRKMRETLRLLEERFDYIVIDSPPVMPVSDALLLSTFVDGVALVTDGSRTPRQQVRAACSRLQYARAKLLGIVLNKAQFPRSYYHYYEDYYSGPSID